MREYLVFGDLRTQEGGRVGISVQVFPPGAVVAVSWSPQEASAHSKYSAWGRSSEDDVLKTAITVANAYMRAHPEKQFMFRALPGTTSSS